MNNNTLIIQLIVCWSVTLYETARWKIVKHWDLKSKAWRRQPSKVRMYITPRYPKIQECVWFEGHIGSYQVWFHGDHEQVWWWQMWIGSKSLEKGGRRNPSVLPVSLSIPFRHHRTYLDISWHESEYQWTSMNSRVFKIFSDLLLFGSFKHNWTIAIHPPGHRDPN
jgi:hypothetical protein